MYIILLHIQNVPNNNNNDDDDDDICFIISLPSSYGR
jgi:hypothetical protein